MFYDKGGFLIICENCVGGGFLNVIILFDGSFCIVCLNDVGFNV